MTDTKFFRDREPAAGGDLHRLEAVSQTMKLTMRVLGSTNQIVELHDHKGALAIVWYHEPSDQEKLMGAYAWDWIGTGTETADVDHFVAYRAYYVGGCGALSDYFK